MILVDPSVVMSIPWAVERKMFACLWEQWADDKDKWNLWVIPTKERLAATGLGRQARWQGMKFLEKHGFIRRRPGSNSWSVVAINPLAIRDSSMTAKQIGDEAMLFNRITPISEVGDEA